MRKLNALLILGLALVLVSAVPAQGQNIISTYAGAAPTVPRPLLPPFLYPMGSQWTPQETCISLQTGWQRRHTPIEFS